MSDVRVVRDADRGETSGLDEAGPLDEPAVRRALEEIPDPELPVVSIADLGMIRSVEVAPDRLRVELLPTFVGCPALDLIRDAVAERLERLAPDRVVEVITTMAEPWTSDRITERGRRHLNEAGMAPPLHAGTDGPLLVRLDAPVACPHCGSTRTRLENVFGPTLCRTIRWCADCRQPFEHLKTV